MSVKMKRFHKWTLAFVVAALLVTIPGLLLVRKHRAESSSQNNKLLILGIEDFDLTEGTESASDDLLKALGDLIGNKS